MWHPLWSAMSCVWSYYDLNRLLVEDGVKGQLSNFYHAPMGVDTKTFRRWPDRERYLAMATGMVAESECLNVAADAVQEAGGKMLLVTGNELEAHYADAEHVSVRKGIKDDVMAQLYSRSRFTLGLRRHEGFELPLLEGIACGSIPVCLDQPDQRRWFRNIAVFIQEGSSEVVQQQLVELFRNENHAAMAVSAQYYWSQKRRQFDWLLLAAEFWERALSRPSAIRAGSGKKRLLWLGDAAVPSGFAACTHGILDNGLARQYDVEVIGMNYKGVPNHGYPYPIWPCQTHPGDTPMGEIQLARRAIEFKPDVIVIQQDPWNIPGYMRRLKEVGAVGRIPIIGALAVDGKNCRGEDLNDLSCSVFWTEFGRAQAIQGGCVSRTAVIGLGVDRSVFKPMDKMQARAEYGIPIEYRERFIVGYVGRNQPRKRLDLLIHYFAQWAKSNDRQDAMLHLHVAPTGEDAFDLAHLMRYYFGKNDRRLILSVAHPKTTPAEVAMMLCSNDVFATLSQAEGWCLPVAEAMACGVATIFPAWAALDEWPRGAGIAVPCTNIAVTERRINSIGGIADPGLFIDALDEIYRNADRRAEWAKQGLAHISDSRFSWPVIGQQWKDLVGAVLKNEDAKKAAVCVTA
jgi:D-inositol-3-phosphate glycosyltransferase